MVINHLLTGMILHAGTNISPLNVSFPFSLSVGYVNVSWSQGIVGCNPTNVPLWEIRIWAYGVYSWSCKVTFSKQMMDYTMTCLFSAICLECLDTQRCARY